MSQGHYEKRWEPAADSQAVKDDEHLRLLRIFYFISAGFSALLIPFGLLYAGMGFMLLGVGVAPSAASGGLVMSGIFGLMGLSLTLIAALGTGLKVLTAIRLKQRRSRTLCLVTAGLCCLEVPYGTALGVATFLVLDRDSIRRRFSD